MSEDDARYVMNIAKATLFGVYSMLLQLNCADNRIGALTTEKNNALSLIEKQFNERPR